MDPFDREYCCLCGGGALAPGAFPLEDGVLCPACAQKLSPRCPKERILLSLDAASHLNWRARSERLLQAFSPDEIFGREEKVHLDTAARLLVIADDLTGTPDVFPLVEVLSCRAEAEDGLFRVVFQFQNRWVGQASAVLYGGRQPVPPGSPEHQACRQELDRLTDLVGRLSRLARAHLYQTGPIPGGFPAYRGPQAGMTPPAAPAGGWRCGCGAANTHNFCTECGRPRPGAD